MTAPKHTPGPWSTVVIDNTGDIQVLAEDGAVVAEAWPFGSVDHGQEIQPANARLIAAAPMQDAALRLVCKVLALWRDGELPDSVNLEEVKYLVVDRAIELADPGFDGGETTALEVIDGIDEINSAIAKATRP